MDAIQILIVLFGIFAFTRALWRFRDNEIRAGTFSFWALVWICVILFAIFPGPIVALASILGISRVFNFLIYAGILILFYLVFRLYVKIQHQDQTLTKLVRSLAISEEKKKLKKK